MNALRSTSFLLHKIVKEHVFFPFFQSVYCCCFFLEKLCTTIRKKIIFASGKLFQVIDMKKKYDKKQSAPNEWRQREWGESERKKAPNKWKICGKWRFTRTEKNNNKNQIYKRSRITKRIVCIGELKFKWTKPIVHEYFQLFVNISNISNCSHISSDGKEEKKKKLIVNSEWAVSRWVAFLEMIWKRNCHYFTIWIGMCVSGMVFFLAYWTTLFAHILSFFICCVSAQSSLVFAFPHAHSLTLSHVMAYNNLVLCISQRVLMYFDWVLRKRDQTNERELESTVWFRQKTTFISPEKCHNEWKLTIDFYMLLIYLTCIIGSIGVNDVDCIVGTDTWFVIRHILPMSKYYRVDALHQPL